MSLNHYELGLLVEELLEISVPAGVQKVYERDEHAVVLQLRSQGATRFLLIDATPNFTRLHFIDAKPRQPAQARSFVMLLRKHLVGSVLLGAELAPDDRIVRLRFERRADDGAEQRELVAELTGRHGNVHLLGPQAQILGMLHRSAGARAMRPGGVWEPPAAPERTRDTDRLGLAALAPGARSRAVVPQFADEMAERGLEEGRTELRRLLGSEARRLRRLIRNVEGDLARAEEAQSFRRLGELLQSAYTMELPRGAASVAVPDYWQEGAPLVDVPLDPARSLQGNIDRYFHEYRRLHAATERIEQRLIDSMERAEQVDAARERLECADADAVASLRDELQAGGLLREVQRKQAQTERRGPRLVYRMFRAHNGDAILVGRGSRDNDALTTKVARGRDIWLHARDLPGSHVLLRMDKDAEPDGEALLEAAILAAHFSKGREDSLIDVTYTRAKHVKKPKGAPAGLVTVAGGSTIAVGRDPARLQRLLAREEIVDS